MAGPKFKLDSDRRTITVTFPKDLPAEMKLSVAQVDDLLSNIGEMRARMEPGVQAGWPTGQTFHARRNPSWVTEPETMKGESVIHLRDPRFGWLHYILPREMARKLGSLLVAQADAEPPRPANARIH